MGMPTDSEQPILQADRNGVRPSAIQPLRPSQREGGYCAAEGFFVVQAVVLEGQQQDFIVLHFLVAAQVFCEAWLQAQPVRPTVAMQATERRVTSDFITRAA
jgi:hypothetical protein